MIISKKIVNLIFPLDCKQCGNPISADTRTSYFCNNCWDGIRWFEGPCCVQCGLPYTSVDSQVKSAGISGGHLCGACSKDPPAFDKAIPAGPYEGVLAEAIRLFKYKKKIHIGQALTDEVLMAPLIAELFITEMELMADNGRCDFPDFSGRRCVPTNTCLSNPVQRRSCYIIPVPLHIKRLREREFNQSAIIAFSLGVRFGIPVLIDVLTRLRHTKPQVELGMKERIANVVGAFTVKNREIIKGKDIILVDDVYTTGSTVNECARALKKNDARMVYVVTIARMV